MGNECYNARLDPNYLPIICTNYLQLSVFCIDNLQHLEGEQFAALIAALHKCAQLQLPVALIGAGPRELVGNAGRAKSYAERLFKYPEIEPWISRNISPIIPK